MALTPTLKTASLSVGKFLLNSPALEMLAAVSKAVAVNVLSKARLKVGDNADDVDMICSHKWVKQRDKNRKTRKMIGTVFN